MKSNATKTWGCNGFTFTDLAGSIAGVGILAATLMPAGPRARQIQVKMTDADNLRRLEFACHMYAGENADFEPAPGWGTTARAWCYAANLPPNSGGSVELAKAAYTNQLASLRGSELWPYLMNYKSFVCPQDVTTNLVWAERTVLVTSYCMNASVCAYGNLADGASLRLSQFAADRIQFWESDDSTPFSFNDGSNFPSEGISQRHDEGTVVGDFGGQAEFISFRYFFNLAGSGGTTLVPSPNRAWCNPLTANGH